MPTDPVILEATVDSFDRPRERIVFTRLVGSNDVLIEVETFPNAVVSLTDEPAIGAIVVSAIALRSAALVILDGPDAPQS